MSVFESAIKEMEEHELLALLRFCSWNSLNNRDAIAAINKELRERDEIFS